jgi:hypothetical protein
MMMKVRFCQAEIAREIEMFIINELLWEGGFDPYSKEEDQVRLVFEDIDQNLQIKLQTHAADMFSKNMLGHEEARKLGNIRGKANEQDLYLNKIDIPKLKSEADAKGEAQRTAGVAIAKARPKTATKVKNNSDVEGFLEFFIPENGSQLQAFIRLLESKYQLSSSKLIEIENQANLLLGDKEALKIYLIERLLDD